MGSEKSPVVQSTSTKIEGFCFSLKKKATFSSPNSRRETFVSYMQPLKQVQSFF